MAKQLDDCVVLGALPSPSKIPCPVCSSPMAARAKFCTECKTYRDGKNCKSCGRWIPLGAQQCAECHTFQDFRRFAPGNAVVLSLLLSLISVISAVGPALLNLINFRSETTGFLIGSEFDPAVSRDKHVLVVRLMNSGGRASFVSDASLDLTTVGGGVVPLEIINNRDRQVRERAQTDLKLFADDSAFTVAQGTIPEVIAGLCSAKVSVVVTVGEENLVGSIHEASRRIPAPGRSVRLFVARRLTGKDPEDCK